PPARSAETRRPLVAASLGPARFRDTGGSASDLAAAPLRRGHARVGVARSVVVALAHPLRSAESNGTGRRSETRLLRRRHVGGAVRAAGGRQTLAGSAPAVHGD